jgi:hypothetical protein
MTRGDLIAMVFNDKHDINILTKKHNPPINGNFCNEHQNVRKPSIIQDYNLHMGYTDA